MWNPPRARRANAKLARSVLSEGAELLADLVSEGMRTICFLKSRKGIELIQRFATMRLEERGKGDLAKRIAPYRAGYTPQQRREIEARLASGDLLGVVATDALELGIDIGELDAAICVTFPGTVASLRQMWGRAGRRSEGLAVYVAGEDALDQFFCRHPEEFLERPVEAAILDHAERADPDRSRLGRGARGAARRQRLLAGRGRRRDPRRGAGASAPTRSSASGRLRRSPDGRYLPRGPEFPAGEISLRSASMDSVAVVDSGSGEMIGDGRGRARVHDDPPGRGLPAHGPLLRGPRARHRDAPGDRRALRRRLVHAAEEGDERLHRPDHRAAQARWAASSTAARSRSPSRSSPTSASGSPTTR